MLSLAKGLVTVWSILSKTVKSFAFLSILFLIAALAGRPAQALELAIASTPSKFNGVDENLTLTFNLNTQGAAVQALTAHSLYRQMSIQCPAFVQGQANYTCAANTQVSPSDASDGVLLDLIEFRGVKTVGGLTEPFSVKKELRILRQGTTNSLGISFIAPPEQIEMGEEIPLGLQIDATQCNSGQPLTQLVQIFIGQANLPIGLLFHASTQGNVASYSGTVRIPANLLPATVQKLTASVGTAQGTCPATSASTMVTLLAAAAASPSLAISLSEGQPSPVAGEEVLFDLEFSEPVVPGPLLVQVAGTAEGSLHSVSGSGTSWTAAVRGMQQSGTIRLFVNANTILSNTPGRSFPYATSDAVSYQALGFATAALPAAKVGQSYSHQIELTGRSGDETWGIDGTAPAGLDLSAGGVVTWTPAVAPGSYVFTAYVVSGSRRIEKEFTITLAPAEISFNPPAEHGYYDAPLQLSAQSSSGASLLFSAIGTSPCMVSPSGVLTASDIGDCIVTVAEATPQPAISALPVTRTIRLTAEVPVIDANGIVTVFAGRGTTIAVQLAQGSQPMESVEIVNHPDYGSLSVAGADLLYTPQVGYFGLDIFTYSARNVAGPSASVTLMVNVVQQGLNIAPVSLNHATKGIYYELNFLASGGTAPYSYSSTGALPNGMSFLNGVLSGAPLETGTYPIVVTATDPNNAMGTQNYTLTVREPAPIAQASSLVIPANSEDVPLQLNLSGGAHDRAYIVGAPANGTAWVDGDRILYSPRAGYSGPDSLTYYVSNDTGRSEMASITLTISPPQLHLTTTLAPSLALNERVQAEMAAQGGTSPYSFAMTDGALPDGMHFSPSGEFSGSPSEEGNYSVVVQATDANGVTGQTTLAFSVVQTKPIAVASHMTVSANSSGTPAVLSLSGGEPETLSLVVQAINGTAVVDGLSITYSPEPGFSGFDIFQYRAENTGGPSETAVVFVTVTPPILEILPASLPAGQSGQAYTVQLSALHGRAPYEFDLASGALPDGLSLSPSGLITGMPAQNGRFAATVTAEDSLGAQGTLSFEIEIAHGSGITPGAPTGTADENGMVTLDLAQGASGPVTGARIIAVHPATAGQARLLPSMAQKYIPWAPQPVMMEFTANAGFSGTVQVEYVLTGPNGASEAAFATINVVASYADPLAEGDALALATAQAASATRIARSETDRLHGHIRDLRQSACMSNHLSLAFTGPSKGKGKAAENMNLSREACSDLGRGALGVWADVALEFGEWEDATFATALDHASRSLRLGLDYRLDSRTLGGVTLSYTRDVTTIGDAGSESRNRAYSLSGYLSYDLGQGGYIDSILGVSKLDFTSERWLASEGIFALGERGGETAYFSIAAGKQFVQGTTLIDGYLRLSGASARLDRFSEKTGRGALDYRAQEVESLVASLGFEVSGKLDLPNGLLQPRLRGELSHDFADEGQVQVSYIAQGVEGALYEQDLLSRSNTDLSLGFGFDFAHLRGWNLSLDLASRLDKDGMKSGDLRLKWAVDF